MTTYSELITQSLRSISVLESNEVAEGEEAKEGLVTLNQLMHSMIYKNIDLEHTTGELTDTIPLPEDQIGPLRYCFMKQYATEFGVQLTPDQRELAREGERMLRVAYTDPQELEMPDTLKAIYSPNNLYLNRL